MTKRTFWPTIEYTWTEHPVAERFLVVKIKLCDLTDFHSAHFYKADNERWQHCPGLLETEISSGEV